ncbi:hypothetical protein BH10ACT5_BH10ACT5_08910 [soil metagenome]
MAGRRTWRASASLWGAVALLTVTAIGAGTLVAAAYQHAAPLANSGEPAPVPSFDLGVQTPTPTPTPEPSAAAIPRESERFLTVGTGAGSNVWWRGVAGACDGAPPVVERSTDAGATWTDVTPLYKGASQLAALDSLDQTEAEIIGGVGPTCEPQALRTFTQGQFWDSYPDVLAASRFVALTDPAIVQQPAGPVAAPCAEAQGLRTQGDLVALVCDATAYVSRAAGEWVALPAPDAAAVAIDGDAVLVAHTSGECNGLSLTRYAAADPAQPEPPRCSEGADPSQPTAIAPTDAGTLIWSGESPPVIE